MSKTSAKQRYTQLMEWLSTNGKKQANTRKPKRLSKLDHYKKQGVR